MTPCFKHTSFKTWFGDLDKVQPITCHVTYHLGERFLLMIAGVEKTDLNAIENRKNQICFKFCFA